MKIKCWSCGALVELSKTTCHNCGKLYVTKQQCGDRQQDIIILHIDATAREMNAIREYTRSVASLSG
jgi:hypothetical protein